MHRQECLKLRTTMSNILTGPGQSTGERLPHIKIMTRLRDRFGNCPVGGASFTRSRDGKVLQGYVCSLACLLACLFDYCRPTACRTMPPPPPPPHPPRSILASFLCHYAERTTDKRLIDPVCRAAADNTTGKSEMIDSRQKYF